MAMEWNDQEDMSTLAAGPWDCVVFDTHWMISQRGHRHEATAKGRAAGKQAVEMKIRSMLGELVAEAGGVVTWGEPAPVNDRLLATLETLIKKYVKNKGTPFQFIAMIGGGKVDTITPLWDDAIAAVEAARGAMVEPTGWGERSKIVLALMNSGQADYAIAQNEADGTWVYTRDDEGRPLRRWLGSQAPEPQAQAAAMRTPTCPHCLGPLAEGERCPRCEPERCHNCARPHTGSQLCERCVKLAKAAAQGMRAQGGPVPAEATRDVNAKAAYVEALAEGGWVYIEDRKPEHNQVVGILDKHGRRASYRFLINGPGHTWKREPGAESLEYRDWTHWRPLQDPSPAEQMARAMAESYAEETARREQAQPAVMHVGQPGSGTCGCDPCSAWEGYCETQVAAVVDAAWVYMQDVGHATLEAPAKNRLRTALNALRRMPYGD